MRWHSPTYNKGVCALNALKPNQKTKKIDTTTTLIYILFLQHLQIKWEYSWKRDHTTIKKKNSRLLFVCGEPLTTQVFAAIDAWTGKKQKIQLNMIEAKHIAYYIKIYKFLSWYYLWDLETG